MLELLHSNSITITLKLPFFRVKYPWQTAIPKGTNRLNYLHPPVGCISHFVTNETESR